jgi:hypothetical protein
MSSALKSEEEAEIVFDEQKEVQKLLKTTASLQFINTSNFERGDLFGEEEIVGQKEERGSKLQVSAFSSAKVFLLSKQTFR